MQYAKIISVISFSCFLAACSINNDKAVREAAPPKIPAAKTATQSVENIDFPSTTSVSGTDENIHVVPKAVVSQPEEGVVPTIAPPGSDLEQQAKDAKKAEAAKKPGPAKSTVVSSSGSGLSVGMPYAQAWPKIGKALPTLGYPIMERDTYSGTYYVLDKISSGGVVKRDTPIYQVRLQKAGDKTSVTVLDSKNQPANADISKRILGSLKNSI